MDEKHEYQHLMWAIGFHEGFREGITPVGKATTSVNQTIERFERAKEAMPDTIKHAVTELWFAKLRGSDLNKQLDEAKGLMVRQIIGSYLRVELEDGQPPQIAAYLRREIERLDAVDAHAEEETE